MSKTKAIQYFTDDNIDAAARDCFKKGSGYIFKTVKNSKTKKIAGECVKFAKKVGKQIKGGYSSCELPPQLLKQFPLSKYEIRLDQHKKLGDVYFVQKRKESVLDNQGSWYDNRAKHLFTIPIGASNSLSKEELNKTQQWKDNIMIKNSIEEDENEYDSDENKGDEDEQSEESDSDNNSDKDKDEDRNNIKPNMQNNTKSYYSTSIQPFRPPYTSILYKTNSHAQVDKPGTYLFLLQLPKCATGKICVTGYSWCALLDLRNKNIKLRSVYSTGQTENYEVLVSIPSGVKWEIPFVQIPPGSLNPQDLAESLGKSSPIIFSFSASKSEM